MGRNISQSAGSSAFTTVTVGETVTAGQVAVVQADGLGYYAADPQIAGMPVLRPIFQAASAGTKELLAPTTLQGAYSWAGNTATNRIACATLTNGNIVIAWVGSALNVQFALLNSAGVQQGSTVTVGPSAATNLLTVVALTGGNFAVGYLFGAITKYAVYSNTGAVVTAATTVETLLNTTSATISMCALTNGSFVFAVIAQTVGATTFQPRFAIFSPTGSVVTANAIVGSGYSYTNTTQDAISVCALTNGNFVLSTQFFNGSAYSVLYAIYSNTGTVVLSQAAATSSGTIASIANVMAVALTGGGFVIVTNQAGSGLYAFFYNAAGASQGSVTAANALGINVDTFNAIPSSDGGIFIAYRGDVSTPTYALNIRKYSALGVASGGINPTVSAQVGSAIGMVQTTDGSVTVQYRDQATGANGFYRVDLACTAAVVSVSATNVGYGNFGIRNTLPQITNTNLKSGSYAFIVAQPMAAGFSAQGYLDRVPSTVPLGVFVSSATSGQAAAVQYLGSATLAAPFLQPYTVNAQNNSIPGQRMSVIGAAAVMFGILQPVSSFNPIN